MKVSEVPLPFAEAGRARVRALTGEDEAFVVEDAPSLSPAARTTALLARCVTHIGSARRVTLDDVRALTVGECDALLLHLRRLTFGEWMAAVVHCPRVECSAALDVDLRVSDLLVPVAHTPDDVVSVECGSNGGRRVRHLRTPTSGDMEAVASIAARDVADGAAALLARCVVSAEECDAWSADDIATAGAALAARDAQADITLDLTCPECGTSFRSGFDTSAYILREIADAARTLFHEVHLLASRYHWSERDILRLSRARRRAYVDAALAGGGA